MQTASGPCNQYFMDKLMCALWRKWKEMYHVSLHNPGADSLHFQSHQNEDIK